jgi:hypothetical protein
MMNSKGNFVDKFLAMTYMLNDQDRHDNGSKLLENILITNFKKLTIVRDMPCEGWIYVVDHHDHELPQLHGLIRMSVGLLTNKSISASDNRFKGRNVVQDGRKGIPRPEKLKMLLRPANVRRWVKYIENKGELVGNKDNVLWGIDDGNEDPRNELA